MDLSIIYSEHVLGHSRNPRNRKSLQDAIRLESANPSCGDEITLFVKVVEGVIRDAGYEGHGCAISQASTDMMLDLIRGRTVAEAKTLAGIFIEMLRGEGDPEQLSALGEAAVLRDIRKIPSRIRCAALAWRTLLEQLPECEDGHTENGIAGTRVVSASCKASDGSSMT